MKFLSLLSIALWMAPSLLAGSAGRGHAPFLRSELIFPLEPIHNHGSCIVECPNGDLLVCWYHGSGERKADDVVVLGSRRRKGTGQWSAPFIMADTPGYPDTNPAMFIDPQERLWLLWPTILANQWETALMKFRISSNFQKEGPPKWVINEILHVTPGTNFTTEVHRALDDWNRQLMDAGKPAEFDLWAQQVRALATNKLSCRLGWMTRAHPFVLDGSRLIVPLYSDGFNFSLMAISDDWGKSWQASAPVVGLGNVQPSIVRKRNGTLVAFMRDNGPAPHRVQRSESDDRGLTWSRPVDTDRLDPGAGLEVLVLKSGSWLLIHNDLEQGRHSLAVSLSDDEGDTWRWTRHLEQDTETQIKAGPGSYHYPSIIQARNGTLHASYSFQERQEPALENRLARKSIKHAHFTEDWIREGERKD